MKEREREEREKKRVRKRKLTWMIELIFMQYLYNMARFNGPKSESNLQREKERREKEKGEREREGRNG